jgi:hypothetical protein
MDMIAKATRLSAPPKDCTSWNAPPWQAIPSERLGNYMGSKPAHFPRTEVKIAYDAMAVHVMFRVADRYVRATAARHQDSVCGDSCVEFFFTPGSDVSQGYFNIEMNCGGTMLFHFQSGPDKEKVVIPVSECEKMRKTYALPRIVDPEIEEPVTWSVGYALPINLLQRYCAVSPPQPGAEWRANFYKCADNTSHPHWLTWAPVDYPRPNFHLPRSFGVLAFE